MLVICSVLAAFIAPTSDRFYSNYVIWILPAFVIWSFNGAGILDGFRMSGVSGVSGSIPYVISAITLVVTSDASDFVAGKQLGAAFTIGQIITVSIHFISLRVAGCHVQFVSPRRSGIARAAIDGTALLASTIPGQLYFRTQLLICDLYLDPASTASFIYVKQIIAAFAQVIGFVRRVEFPNLVTALATHQHDRFRVMMTEQRHGTLISTFGSIFLLIIGLTLAMIRGRNLRRSLFQLQSTHRWFLQALSY